MTMNGCIFSRVMSKLCSAPSTRPPKMTAARASGQAHSYSVSRSMNITPSSANMEPIERSIPPVMITSPSPIENTPNRPIRFAMFEQVDA